MKLIAQSEGMTILDWDVSFEEFEKEGVMKLTNDKAPGVTDVPPQAPKLLDDENLRYIYKYFVDFWNGKVDYWQWHVGLGVMIPMKGDLRDPNKWQEINLTDVCSKVFSCILNNRLYNKLLKNHDIKTQFGAIPGVGCADGSFALKTLLHQCEQHNLESYVIFVDLVKASDTVNHDR